MCLISKMPGNRYIICKMKWHSARSSGNAPLGCEPGHCDDVFTYTEGLFQGAYKKPRELNWIVGVLIFCHARAWLYRLLASLGHEGSVCNKSRPQIAEATPLIGTQVKTLAGHPDIVGAQTLTRFLRSMYSFFLPHCSG